MAALDFSTFTVKDDQSVLTIEPNRIAVGENGKANLTAYLYKDFGEGGIQNFEYKFKLRFNPSAIAYEQWLYSRLVAKNVFVLSNGHCEKPDPDDDCYPIVRVTVSPAADPNDMTVKPAHYMLSGWSLNKGFVADHSKFSVVKEGDEQNQILDWVFDRCRKEDGNQYNWWWKVLHYDNGYDRPT